MGGKELELPYVGCIGLGARSLPAGMWLVFLEAFFFAFSVVPCVSQTNAKNVLVLYSFSNPQVAGSSERLESAVRSRVPMPVNFYVEDLDLDRIGDPGYDSSRVNSLHATYLQQKFDLVMVSGYMALQFALQHREELFPGVPIVFFTVVSQRMVDQKMWPGVTGVTETIDLSGTINYALKFHPNAQAIAVISSDTGYDPYLRDSVHSDLALNHRDIKEIDISGLPPDQLLRRTDTLPNATIVLFGLDPRKTRNPAIAVWDILEQISQRQPAYCVDTPDCLAHGGIGGVFFNVDEEIALAAELAGRVLSGERPENIPIVNGSQPRFYANWKELQRWHIPESALPAGSVILNRPPTLWEQYRSYVIVTIAVTGVLLLLIIALLWERARKREAETVLRESEERFRVMADSTPALVWMCDEHGKITYLNDRWIAYAGPDADTGYGDTWLTYIHPDDVKNVLNTQWQALKDQKSFSKEYRLHRSDGVYRWMFDVASPRVNGDGTFAGFIGSAIDVTDQKLAQQALEQVSGQLIEAQEKERTRIARDLHDDICQRLALLSMELEQAKRDSMGRVSATENLEQIRQHCSEIAGDVQSLSHQLHSSKLDYLGIVSAIRGFCDEFHNQHGVNVEFTQRNVPAHLPKDISLCLFRVAQESLHNAIKYSGTDQFKVHLSATADQVQLQVTDAGVGFDVEETKKNRGLGLVSMQERVHLVHGRFAVESKPGTGTKVIAVVPLAKESGHVTENETAKETANLRGTS